MKILKEARLMTNSDTNIAEKENFYTWFESTTSPISVSEIIMLDMILLRNKVIKKHISKLSIEEAEAVLVRFKSGEVADIHSKSLCKKVIDVISAYKDYLTLKVTSKAHDRENNDIHTSTINSDEISHIKNTLGQPRFKYGFKDDIVELSKFRDIYIQVNGIKCPLSDDQLNKEIRQIGFNFNGKIYLIDDNVKKKILSELEQYGSRCINIIYCDMLFDKNFESYDNDKIVSSDMLKALLEDIAPENRYKGKYFTFSQEKATEIEWVKREIIRVWGSNTFQTFDELANKLPLIPFDKIKHVLAQQSEFIRNSPETYLRWDRLLFLEDDVKTVLKYMDNAISSNGYVNFEELPLAEIRDVNPNVSEAALNTAFYKIIEDKYDRNDKVLTKKGERKDTYAAVTDYCRGKEKCTYSELENVGQKTTGIIKRPEIIEAANASMIRVSKNTFVKDSLVNFDVDRIDRAIDGIVLSDFVGMREITTFATFPFCGYAWNLYLLESYCRRFSKKYKYETRLANSSNSGAVVFKNCHMSYHDIMTHAVARSNWKLTIDSAYDFLTYAGYIERKRYNKIDILVKQAAELRGRRE